jgi:ribosomal protein L11 methyltransferase
MKRKPLWRISVITTLEAEDAVAEWLGHLLGESASSYHDWETRCSQVSVYRQSHPGPAAELRRTLKAGLEHLRACGLELGPASIQIRRIRHEDWAESWKRHFKPIEIGRTVLIKPSWSRRRPKPDQQVVVLDPGLSFGTGQHPTTAFCLAEVARLVKNAPPRSFLDIGTGSGILAIVAARLNYQPIWAFDFDPEAVRMARANAQTNQVEKKIRLTRGDLTRLPARPARRYDLVCANLISTLLRAEQKRILSLLNQGGTLVLAGILKAEFPAVRAAYQAAGGVLIRTEARNEWQSATFHFAKKV